MLDMYVHNTMKRLTVTCRNHKLKKESNLRHFSSTLLFPQLNSVRTLQVMIRLFGYTRGS